MKTRKNTRKSLSLLLAVAMFISILPALSLPTASADFLLPDHLIINQTYGNGKNADGAVSHSFIEIYNPTETAVNLSTWSLQYATNGSGGEISGSVWEKLDLTGTIPPKHSYLIRANGGKTDKTRYEIYYADQEWPLIISNDSYKFALVSNKTKLSVSNPGAAQGVVDLIGAYNSPATIDFSEGNNPRGGGSKQKSARRIDFADTDINAADFEIIDYRSPDPAHPNYNSGGISDTRLIDVRPCSLIDGEWTPVNRPPLPSAPVTGTITFSDSAGLYETPFDLTLDFVLPGEAVKSDYEIRYTLDGEDVKPTSPIYSGPLSMQDRTATGGAPLSQIPNTSTSNGGATHDWYINPNPNDVFQGTVVKAQLFTKQGEPASGVYINSYFVSSNIFSRYGNMPVISVSTPKDYFFDWNTGIYVRGPGSVANWDNNWERPVNFEMFEQSGNTSQRVISQGMGVRIHGAASRGIAQKTLRFYTRNGLVDGLPLNNGSPTINYDLFNGTPGDVGIKRFQLRGHSNDAHRALIRDPFSAVIGYDFANDTEAYRPAIMFLNGEFWGVYQIRERFDDEYLAQYNGGDKNRYEFIEDPSTYYYGYTDPDSGTFYNVGGMTSENGTPEAIQYYLDTVSYLDNFIASKGINTVAAYNEFMKYVDIDNLIDYTILRTFIGDNDWVNKARPADLQTFGKHQLMWRYAGTPVSGTTQDGRYRWMHKDGDFAFQGPTGNTGGGNGANAGVHGMGFDSISCIMKENPENYYFFNRLMLNDTFRMKFINRYMDVMNTYFSISKLNSTLYGMKNEIDMAMNEHFKRWSYNNRAFWEYEIDRISSNMTLRTSVNPSQSGITRGLNLLAGAARANLTLKSSDGYIRLNGIDIKSGAPGVTNQANWTGQYHVGFTQTLEAVASPGKTFSHFIIAAGGNTTVTSEQKIEVVMAAGGVTVTAVFDDGGAPLGFDGLIILQAYGAGAAEDGSISHSFIELYNTSDQPVSLNGLSIQYSGLNEARTALTPWEMLKLSGTIPAKTSYLIRANGHNNTATNRYVIYDKDGDKKTGYDVSWNIVMSNRLMMIALVDHQQKINTYDKNAITGLIDSIASYNGSTDLAFMGSNWNSIGNVTKQKTVRRVDFGQTLEAISYRSLTPGEPSYDGKEGIDDATLILVRPCSLSDGPWTPESRPPLPKAPVTGGAPIINFSKEAGLYENNFQLELSTPSGYTIHYTIDGDDPTAASPEYTGEILVYDRTKDTESPILSRTQNTVGPLSLCMQTYVRPERGTNFRGMVIKAQLFDEQDEPVGKMYINSYFIDKDIYGKFGDLPIVSITTPRENFIDPVKGIYIHPNELESGAEWERPVFFEMFEPDGTRVLNQGMGVRMQGGVWNRQNPQKSLRFYARSGNLANGMPVTNGEKVIAYDLFQGEATDGAGNPLTTGFTRFMLRDAGNDLCGKYNIYLGAFMRDALTSVISRDYAKFETMAYRPVVAFINGEFWGLYNMRQRYDDEFLALAYGGLKNDYTVLEGPTLWYVSEINDGTEEDAQDFLSKAQSVWYTDLSNDTNYQYVVDNYIDEDSLIDYVIVETFIANRDWAASHNNNQRIWRYKGTPEPGVLGHDGKYRWMMYDTDESYGGGADPRYPYPILTKDDDDVLAKLLSNGQENLPFFTKLWENAQFRDKFINRYMDSLNTYLLGSVTVPIVTKMEAGIDKVMNGEQQNRWNYTLEYEEWQQNVANIKTWLQGRASQNPGIGALPVIVAKHAKNTNLATLTLVNQDGLGHIILNGMALKTGYPGVGNQALWTGKYFAGYEQTLTAVPNSGETFAGFRVVNNSTGVSYTTTSQTIQLTMSNAGYTVIALYGGEVGDFIVSTVGVPAYTAAYVGDPASLPEISVLYLSGKIEPAVVDWDLTTFMAAEAYDMIDLTGTVSGTSFTVTVRLEIIPRGLVYFIDSGLAVREGQKERTSSAAYDAVAGMLATKGKTLYNEVFDKFYTGSSDSWGVIKATVNSSFIEGEQMWSELDAYSAASKFVPNYYGWNTFQTEVETAAEYDPNLPLYIEYRLYLPAGEYMITTGHYLFCERSTITQYYPDGHYGDMEILFNGQQAQAPFRLEHEGQTYVWTNEFIQETDGELVIRFNTTDRDGAIVSFIGVQDLTERQTYNVTFDAGNGTTNLVFEVNEGNKVKEPAVPVKPGYIFKGWYLDGGTKFDFDTPVYSEFTLTAGWEARAVSEVTGSIYAAAYVGELTSLPWFVDVKYTDDSIGTAAVVWDTEPFLAADVFDMIELTGTVAGTDLTVNARIEVIPRDVVYFIDSGLKVRDYQQERTSSAAYDAVAEKLASDGKTLYNEVFDKYYNNAGDGWGVIKETVSCSFIEGEAAWDELDAYRAASKFVPNYYGWNTFQTIDGTFLDGSLYEYDPDLPLYIEYRLYLPKGEYLITTAHYLFCERSTITAYYPDGHYGDMEILFNGQQAQAPFRLEHEGQTYVWTNEFKQEEDGELVIRFNTTDRDGAIVSFIGVRDVTPETVVTHTVTFVDWDGSVLKTEEVQTGFAATAPSDPARIGYAFTGWDKDFSIVTDDMTVTALYIKVLPNHLIINQVYGSDNATDGAVSNSFIELYNPTDQPVDLSTWSVQYLYQYGTGAQSGWFMLPLEGIIPAYHSFLIVATDFGNPNARYKIPEADMYWAGRRIQNNAFTIALVENQTVMPNDGSVDLNDPNVRLQKGVIDLVGASNTGYVAVYYEGAPLTDKVSKQKSVRRVDFFDTDINLEDFETIDYRVYNSSNGNGMLDDRLAVVRPRSLADGPWYAGDTAYAVIFDYDNGQPATRVKVNYNNTVAEPNPEPTKEGYEFIGWFKGADKFDFSTPITAIITLTAQWKLSEITYRPEDINMDGDVNVLDLSILLANFGKSGAEITVARADINGDGDVNVLDLSRLLAEFGK